MSAVCHSRTRWLAEGGKACTKYIGENKGGGAKAFGAVGKGVTRHMHQRQTLHDKKDGGIGQKLSGKNRETPANHDDTS